MTAQSSDFSGGRREALTTLKNATQNDGASDKPQCPLRKRSLEGNGSSLTGWSRFSLTDKVDEQLYTFMAWTIRKVIAMDGTERFFAGMTVAGMICLCAAFTMWMLV